MVVGGLCYFADRFTTPFGNICGLADGLCSGRRNQTLLHTNVVIVRPKNGMPLIAVEPEHRSFTSGCEVFFHYL
jgi:hypothetical protein